MLSIGAVNQENLVTHMVNKSISKTKPTESSSMLSYASLYKKACAGVHNINVEED